MFKMLLISELKYESAQENGYDLFQMASDF
jgi:hypothetical protein